MRFEIEEEGDRYRERVYNWKVIETDENGRDNLIATSTDDYTSVVECVDKLARFVARIEVLGKDMLDDLVNRLD